MTRRSYVQVDGVLYVKGTEPGTDGSSIGGTKGYPTILPDLPDFVSPIDGKLYSGRTGLRDHCVRHGVVPTADLAGLPIGKQKTYTEDRKGIRDVLVRTMYERGYFKDHL